MHTVNMTVVNDGTSALTVDASSRGVPLGAIVGGSIGGVVVLALVILAIVTMLRRRSKARSSNVSRDRHAEPVAGSRVTSSANMGAASAYGTVTIDEYGQTSLVEAE
jgi:hypothetical protein